jgi:hypothetical protein
MIHTIRFGPGYSGLCILTGERPYPRRAEGSDPRVRVRQVGEFWYKLKLTSLAPDPIRLEPVSQPNDQSPDLSPDGQASTMLCALITAEPIKFLSGLPAPDAPPPNVPSAPHLFPHVKSAPCCYPLLPTTSSRLTPPLPVVTAGVGPGGG